MSENIVYRGTALAIPADAVQELEDNEFDEEILYKYLEKPDAKENHEYPDSSVHLRVLQRFIVKKKILVEKKRILKQQMEELQKEEEEFNHSYEGLKHVALKKCNGSTRCLQDAGEQDEYFRQNPQEYPKFLKDMRENPLEYDEESEPAAKSLKRRRSVDNDTDDK